MLDQSERESPRVCSMSARSIAACLIHFTFLRGISHFSAGEAMVRKLWTQILAWNVYVQNIDRRTSSIQYLCSMLLVKHQVTIRTTTQVLAQSALRFCLRKHCGCDFSH